MLLIVGGACGAEASPADEFTILSFAPGGMVKGRMPVKVVFSQPVVERDAVGKTVSRQNMPVEFSPDIRGAGKWTDQKTFVFTPVANLQQATLYRATAKESLRDLKNRRLAGKQDFEFHTEPLKLLKAQQTDFTENNNVVIELTFNLPVSPFRMRGFLSILNEQKQQMNYFPMGQAPASVLRISTNAYDGRRLTILLAPGLTSDAGPLGVEKEFRQEISVTRKMEIRSVYADTRYPATSIINVNTSVGADMSVVSRFLELSPKMPFTVEPGYNGFTILGDFKPRRRVELTIRKGLPSRDGHKLERDFSRAVIFPDLYPSLSFPSGGTFLSPAGDLRIPIESVNIEEISLNLWRVYENNIPVSMLSSYSIPRDLARRVATRTARPEGRLNEPVRRAIDLRELAGESKGVFLLTASESSGEYWADAEQLVAVTDLGIVARVWPNGITVWVNTILGIRPVNGAVVRVYSRSNQMVASGKTDGDGLWTWHGKDPWDSQLTPSIVTVEKDDDISFLKLEGNLLADAGFDIGGRPRSEKYDALLFAPRGVFRPGEKVDFSALVRTKDLLPPEPFPVVYVVRSSLGREVTRGTALLSPEGIASFSARLAPASPTGMYSAIVSLPGGESTPLGRTEFFVEDFVAPRLEVKATSDSTFLEEGETLTIDIASSYLFGAPAAGLPFEGEVRAVAVPFRPEGWSAFTFGDPERSFETVTDYIGNGTLDEEGKGELEFSGPEGWLPPASIDLSFFVKVMEESGRWVPAALRIPFHPYPVYLGIEMPKGDQVPGREIRTRIAAVTPEGKPSELEMAVAEVYMVKHHYNLVRMGNQTRMQVQRELVPHSDGTVKFTDGIGSFAFTPKGQGEFVLRISDETSNSMASASMMVWTPYWSGEGEGSTLLDRVVVTPDKEKYEPGDKATLSLRSPFEGNLLVTVETDKELLRKVVPLNKGEVTLQIPVTEAMIPNAYVSASVIRPVVEGQEWGNHRAIGTISIPVERKEHRLSVAILSPERTLPDEPLSVNGTLTDGTGTPRKGEVVLFLVDEGILSLTGYKTPDPWAFFMAKRAQGISVYDLYDQLLPLESRETPLLRAGGGAGEEAMAALRAGMSPVSARTFRMLSIFLGSVATDENGSFEATFDVPEFSGKGRLMAVASAGSAFGKGETFVRIARDVTTELSLPRAVSPGDAFHAPLKLFSGASEKTRVSVKVSIDGPLSFSGKKEFLADLVPGAEALFSVPFTAGPQAGTAFLSVETEWEDGAFTQELDLPVRPAFPRVALSGSGVVRGDAPGTIEIPREWFPGTEEGKLLLADLPALDLLGAATFLLQYPYGCLEQTVSGAWPLLALGELVRDIDPRLVNEEERAAALALKIRQISAMQLYTGGFANWPGSSIPSQWGSLYATHFLVEAKKSGAPVPDDLLEIALSNVRSMLPLAPLNDSDSAFRSNMTLKAYAAYILSLRGEPPLGWMAHLGEHKDSLYGSGTVFLAGAHALASGTPDSLRQLGTGAPSLRGGGAETFESVSRNTALKLLMWTEVDPLSAPAAELAFRLLEEARRNTWRTTQDNAMAVLALGRWMEKTREARKPFTAVLKDASGNEIASFSDGKRLSLDLGELPKGAMTLTLSGNGTAYFAWTSAGVPLKEPAPFSSGIAVKRAWTNREGKPVQEGTPVSRGERITVTLILTPSAPLRDLVVVDMLPGGMEIENTRLSGEGDSPDRSGIRAELRDDRLILFVDSLTNSVEYKYLIRAVSRGVFTLPPVAAEGMYAPDTASVGVPGKVEIY
jgi:hypothetical protein